MPSSISPRRAVLLVLAVAACAFALRFHGLESVPPGLYLDEASIGVEAHSIAETGRDQRGTLAPVLFPALQDYKHPLYVYGAALTVKALGPTRLAVRLPAVIFGTLTVVLVALLAMELAKDPRAGVAAALVLALTPWHIQYSRMAWEAVTLGFTAVLALWLYFLARRRGGAWRFALAGAAFGLALYSYTPAKLLVPALLVALALVEWRDFKWTNLIGDRVRRHAANLPAPPIDLGLAELLPIPRLSVRPRDALALAVALAVVAAPMAVFQVLHWDEIQTRFRAVSVFREASPAAAIARSYFAHLDPAFLFVRGDANLRQGWPGWGQLLIATAPFAALALLRAIARRDPEDLVLLAWLAIYPLGAALTSEGIPHASRSFLGAPLFAILAAQGALLCIDRVLSRAGRGVLATLLVGALVGNAALALRSYLTDYPAAAGVKWTAGVERLIPALVAKRGEVQRVHFMPSPHGDVAIVREHVLFLTGFDPALDPARPDSFFVWDTGVVSWPRFLAKLPRDEVLVAWPERSGGHQWGAPAWMQVADAEGRLAFEVHRGRGK